VVVTCGDAGATSSYEDINEGAIVHAGSSRLITGCPAASTIAAARIQCRSAAGWRLRPTAIANPIVSTSEERRTVSSTMVT
jgi:hypothetical protein